MVGVGVFNTQAVQDDVDQDRTGFLLGTPALAREFASRCSAGVIVGLRLTGGSRYDAVVGQEYAHLLTTSAYARSSGGGIQVYVTSAIEAEAQRAIRPEAFALGVFGVIAVLAALIIGIQSISRQLRSGAEDAWVLRALGAGPAVTMADGLLGVLGAAVAGSVLAAAVAVGLSPLTLFGPVRKVYASPGIDLDWPVLGLGALVLTVFLGGGAAVIGYRQAPHRPRGHGGAAVRFGARARAHRRAGPLGHGRRGAGRPCGHGDADLRREPEYTGLAPGPVRLELQLRPVRGRRVGPIPSSVFTPLLAADHSVAATTGVYFATVQIDGQTVPGIAAPARAAVAPPVLSGHGVDGSRQIVLGPATMAQLHKRVGDTVWVSENSLVPRIRLRITGTAPLPAVGTTLSVHPSMSTGALFSSALFSAQARDQFGPFSGPNAIFVRLRPGGSWQERWPGSRR